MDVRQVLFYSPALPSTTTTSPVRRPKLIVTALACACRFSRLPMKLADFTEYNALVTHNNDAATLLVSLSHSPHSPCLVRRTPKLPFATLVILFPRGFASFSCLHLVAANLPHLLSGPATH